MIGLLIALPALIEQAQNPTLHLGEVLVSTPIFKYPSLYRLAKIQGEFEFLVSIEAGRVTKVELKTERARKLLPQIQTAFEPEIRAMQFKPTVTGSITLNLVIKLVGDDQYPESCKTHVTFILETNTIQIEMSPAKVTVCDAPPK